MNRFRSLSGVVMELLKLFQALRQGSRILLPESVVFQLARAAFLEV